MGLRPWGGAGKFPGHYDIDGAGVGAGGWEGAGERG